MIRTKNLHLQFADYFKDREAFPYLYMLSKKLSEGSICLNLENLQWEKEIEEESQLAEYKLNSNKLKQNKLVIENGLNQPMVLSGNRLYFQRYFKYETKVINRIHSMIRSENSQQSKEDLNKLGNQIKQLFSENNTKTTDWQGVAAISAVLNRFTIITGGPGTGKTYTIAKVLSLLFGLNPEMKVALTAPTGKAAARMAESLKITAVNFPNLNTYFERLEPSTIHRLLGSQKDSIYFKHNSENPLNQDLVIVDESSMLDVALFSKLLSAVRKDARLILLGDKNQLTSVEAGSIFGDLCVAIEPMNRFSRQKADLINGFLGNEVSKIKDENIFESKHLLFERVIELKHSFRFSDEGGIGKLSKAVILNQQDKIETFFENNDKQVTMDTDYSIEKFSEFADLFENYIKENEISEALKKLNQIRILCAVKEGDEGIYEANRKVEKYLNEKGLISLGGEFYENRPLIVTGNNYELGLFNGDVGIVRKDKNGVLKVWFEDNDNSLKSVLPASIDSAETVFAMTIHKSQGSEFDNVLVVLPKNQEMKILTAELLYTAISRAKTKICIQSDRETIRICAEQKVERSSGVIERLKSEFNS